ncbi:uncharacterized protein METZ01_LOCUS329962 [marine metagenome]|uniref:Uncharacterized protein n=1 Tax=marine metagenome TaxID=408172 RepID=A0A382PWU5_9ZZZZ
MGIANVGVFPQPKVFQIDRRGNIIEGYRINQAQPQLDAFLCNC